MKSLISELTASVRPWWYRRGHRGLHGGAVGSPNCNPYAERFVRSAREAYADNIQLLDRGHAEKVLTRDEARFNNHRRHQGGDQLAASDTPDVIPSDLPDPAPPGCRRPDQRAPASRVTDLQDC